MYDLEGLNSPQKVSTYAILQMAIESLTMYLVFERLGVYECTADWVDIFIISLPDCLSHYIGLFSFSIPKVDEFEQSSKPVEALL